MIEPRPTRREAKSARLHPEGGMSVGSRPPINMQNREYGAGPDMLPLTVGDLFAGAGGLSLGFERAGFQSLWALDSNEAAVETFSRNLAGNAVRADVTQDFDSPRPSVIIGGPPCQGFSSAGMRRAGDARNSLVSFFSKIVARVRPAAFVFENVEGFLTVDGGERVCEMLDPVIGAGYRVHLRKVNAANFGVPQHRKRVIAVGGFGFDPSFPRPTHSAFGAPGARRHAVRLSPTATVEEAIGDLPSPGKAAPGQPDDHYSNPIGQARLARVKVLGPGQTMRDLPEEHWHASYRRRANRRVMDGTPTERRGGAPAGIRRLRGDEPSKAITGGATGEFVHPFEDRFLTLRECARLQTFPDSFTFYGTRTERSAQIGNAVPPRMATLIAECLARDLLSEDRPARQGALLSFSPLHSKGASPAMQRVTRMVESKFCPVGSQSRLF